MNKEEILKSLKQLRTTSPKRKFKQSIDLVINLKGIDLKKPDQRIDNFLVLNHSKGKPVKTCIFLDKQLEAKAKGKFNTIITKEDFPKWTDKTKLKKLAKSHDFFIAQAILMSLVASTFGKTLGALGKMPNPKAGCVVPPEANLDPLAARLQKTVRVITKNETIIKDQVGIEDMPDEEIADNILTIYNYLMHTLSQKDANIKNIFIKFSMSPPVFIVGGKKQ